MNHIIAVFIKQVQDTLKNKAILLQFVMFPVLALIMQKAVKVENLPANYFITMFAGMYIGMAPLLCMASIIAEEKEKNTLRVLLMANVKSSEYMIGIGGYVWISCMLSSLIFIFAGDYSRRGGVFFLLVMAVGILTSVLIGAAIGTFSRNQISSTSITIPVMIVFSFMPMLSAFNQTIKKIAVIFFSTQISEWLTHIDALQIETKSLAVVGINIVIAAALFGVAYRKCGLA